MFRPAARTRLLTGRKGKTIGDGLSGPSPHPIAKDRLLDFRSSLPSGRWPVCSLLLGVHFEDQVANAFLYRDIGNRPKQREATALAVNGILPRGECHVAAGTDPAFPNREANQLQAGKHAVVEVEFGVSQLSGRVLGSLGMILTIGFEVVVLVFIVSSRGTVMWWFLRDRRNPVSTGAERM